MILRDDPRAAVRHDGDAEGMRSRRVSDAGGLTQYGAYVVTLDPGAQSSERHWHEAEDELLYVLSGEITVIEDDGPHVLGPGDAACWPAGVANAHTVLNASSAPRLRPREQASLDREALVAPHGIAPLERDLG